MTETEVEVKAPAYPPELMNKPFGTGDELIVVECADNRAMEGQHGIVVGAIGHSGTEGSRPYVDVDGIRAYVSKWVHAHEVDEPLDSLPKAEVEVGSTSTILDCICCPALNGQKGVVLGHVDGGYRVRVSKGGEDSEHIASVIAASAPRGNPFAGRTMNPRDVRVGDNVYVLRNETDSGYNFQMGVVSRVPQVYSTEFRDYITARVGGRDVWVSTWMKEKDIPPTMPPLEGRPTLTVLDVYGSSDEKHIGSSGQLQDRPHRGPRIYDGSKGEYVRVRQWSVVATVKEGEGHRHAVPKGARVRILATKSESNANLVGTIAVTAADTDIKRDSSMVAVDGKRVLITEWVPVDGKDRPIRTRYMSLMTDKQVEELLDELFKTADSLADEQSWCNEYDSVMRDVIGRPAHTIRLTTCWRVEARVVHSSKAVGRDDEGTAVMMHEVYHLVVWGNASAPTDENTRRALKAAGVKVKKDTTVSISNYWRL